jgi:haloalkane dehalogenase
MTIPAATSNEVDPESLVRTPASSIIGVRGGMFSVEEPTKRRQDVFGKGMAYVDIGRGLPVVFIHGNPASSYMWRNVMPHVAALARCIAPDLIGMGDSDKLPGTDPARYGFLEHRRYLDELLHSLGADRDVILVGQDWGGALAMDWAKRHPDRIRGIVYMETFFRPRSWEEMDAAQRPTFERLRSPEGEHLVLIENVFVERVMPSRILRQLSDQEMAVYRRPYLNAGEDRRPTLTFPRELAVGGEPPPMVEIIRDYGNWMATNDVPKLFVNGDPGSIVTGGSRDFCRSWKNQHEVTVRGRHFLQEDSPDEIGVAIADWLQRIA